MNNQPDPFNSDFRDYDSAVGRYVESDPIGLKGGVNTFGYVSQGPVIAFDPKGLIKWNGTFGGGSIAAGFGAGLYGFSLTSECKCGKKVSVTGFASSVGGGIGVSGSIYAQQFEDANACPNADVFNGLFAIVSGSLVHPIGAATSSGVAGVSCGNIKLGGAFATIALPGASWCSLVPGIGFDIGVSGFGGTSAVLTSSEQSCCQK